MSCSSSTVDCEPWARARRDFQYLLHQRQTNSQRCRCRRVLEVVPGALDGFALECHTLGRALRMSMATGRTMLLDPAWRSAYASKHRAANSGGWGGLWRHENACPFNATPPTASEPHLEDECGWRRAHPYAGILPKAVHSGSRLFNTRFHGPSLRQRLVVGDFGKSLGVMWGLEHKIYIDNHNYQLAAMHGSGGAGSPNDPIPKDDPVPDWERRYGSFWVRSQLQDFLWRPSQAITRELESHPVLRSLRGGPPQHGSSSMKRAGLGVAPAMHEPYIGFHIRYTDNIPDLAYHFGRDAKITRSFSNYMLRADAIRSALNPKIRTIYLSTDSKHMLNASKDPQWAAAGWSFVYNERSLRTDTTEHIWFHNAGRQGQALNVMVDVEALRLADYLIGSFQSNVFRLAAELNHAHHVGKTYTAHAQRIFSVESIEWYADP